MQKLTNEVLWVFRYVVKNLELNTMSIGTRMGREKTMVKSISNVGISL